MNDNKNFKTCISMKRTKCGYICHENHMFYANNAKETEEQVRRIMEKENATLVEVWHRKDENWDELELEGVFSAMIGKSLPDECLQV